MLYQDKFTQHTVLAEEIGRQKKTKMEEHEIKASSSVTKRNEMNIWSCYLLRANGNICWIGVGDGSHWFFCYRNLRIWWREVLSNRNVLHMVGLFAF